MELYSSQWYVAKIRGNFNKLRYRKFHLNIRRKKSLRTVNHWNRLSRRVVGSPSILFDIQNLMWMQL